MTTERDLMRAGYPPSDPNADIKRRHQIAQIISDAVCEVRGVESCTLPHCDCASIGALAAEKLVADDRLSWRL